MSLYNNGIIQRKKQNRYMTKLRSVLLILMRDLFRKFSNFVFTIFSGLKTYSALSPSKRAPSLLIYHSQRGFPLLEGVAVFIEIARKFVCKFSLMPSRDESFGLSTWMLKKKKAHESQVEKNRAGRKRHELWKDNSRFPSS